MFPIRSVTLSQNGGVSFSNIPQNFKHLQIIINGRCVNSGYATVYAGFNGDRFGSNNYFNNIVYGDGNTYGQTYANQAFFGPHFFIHNGLRANVWAGVIIDILDYTDTTKRKTAKSICAYDTNDANGKIVISTSVWTGTAAVTSIDLEPDAGFIAGTTVSLYGILDSPATGV